MINTNQLARVTLILLLIVGCVFVLYPFMAAMLFSAVVCVFTWPLYQRIWRMLGRRDMLAATVMTLLLLVAFILPMAYLAVHLTGSATLMMDEARSILQNLKPTAPAWIQSLPIIGESLAEFWQRIILNHEELMHLLNQYAEPIRAFLLKVVQLFMGGFMQLVLVVFVAFFFYRDGRRLANGMHAIVYKLGGEIGREMLTLSCNTVNGVMLGVFGTALAQSAVSLFGFWLAGAPIPLLLALATFFLSVIPFGPPLVWGAASLWLFNQGDQGWAIFLAIYGLLVISSVDNIVKPILISHSSHLPLLIVVLGVLGGILMFGFIGIFLGPTLLAVGFTLVSHWIILQNKKADEIL